jgi:DNA-binding protein HU-beta
MNKPDLVNRVADASNLPKGATGKAVDAVFEAISAALVRGEELTLVGFGSFYVNERPARQGRNPKTGEPIEIAASKAPKFKAGKKLRDAVRR